MLEWYRAGESYESLMMDCVRMLALAAETVKTATLTYRGAECDPFAGPERISVAEAFGRHAGIDLLASVSADGSTEREHLAAEMRRVGMRVADDDHWADLFSRVLVEKVEPYLGFGRVTILDEYPVSEAALARPSARDPRVAERFEFYACGVELANGFGELTNAAEQRRRFEIEMAEKMRVYGETYCRSQQRLVRIGTVQSHALERNERRLRLIGLQIREAEREVRSIFQREQLGAARLHRSDLGRGTDWLPRVCRRARRRRRD